MARATQEVQGLRELTETLRQFGPKVVRGALRAAARDSAKEVAKWVKAAAPFKTGAIMRNVQAKTGPRKYLGKYDVRSIVGVKHGKVKSFTRKSSDGTFKTRSLSAYGKRQVETGEDPFYYRFHQFGYYAVGRRKAAGRAKRVARKLGATGERFVDKHKGWMDDGFEASLPHATARFKRTLQAEVKRNMGKARQ